VKKSSRCFKTPFIMGLLLPPAVERFWRAWPTSEGVRGSSFLLPFPSLRPKWLTQIVTMTQKLGPAGGDRSATGAVNELSMERKTRRHFRSRWKQMTKPLK